jgi:putative sigma-54 modulation protein
MIEHINLTTLHVEIDEKTKKYVIAQIEKLDRFLPRHARKSVKADVTVAQINKHHGNKYEVEVILHLPHKRMTAKDSTMNIIAATDIVEAKLEAQLKKYKDAATDHRGHHGTAQAAKQSLK